MSLINSKLKIIQWNINGIYNNYTELQLILKNYSPAIITLQETHIPHNYTPIPPNNYKGLFNNNPHNTTKKQGTGILIHKDIPYIPQTTNSQIQCTAVKILAPTQLTILSIYIPPHQQIKTEEISNLIKSLDSPILITGDFNAWSPAWGSPAYNQRGNIIEQAIHQSNLSILNNGNPTHISTHGTLTHIDLTICSPSLTPIFTWYTLDDPHNSDHLPILISTNITNPHIPSKRTQFQLKRLIGKNTPLLQKPLQKK